MRLWTAALGAALALSTAPAFAQMGAADMAQMLTRADTNNDGVLTLAEARAGREEMFARMDRNGDGTIAGGELRGRMSQLDPNGDGAITRAEFMGRPYMAFDTFDANGDDALDANEQAAMRQAMGQRRANR